MDISPTGNKRHQLDTKIAKHFRRFTGLKLWQPHIKLSRRSEHAEREIYILYVDVCQTIIPRIINYNCNLDNVYRTDIGCNFLYCM